MFPSGQHIGLLGGGQLGTFFTIAAKSMGYRVMVWDPDPNAPAHAWADHSIAADFDNQTSLKTFLSKNNTATFEWENIPLTLIKAIEQQSPIHPGSAVLSRLQNRRLEKTFLSSHDFPVTPFVPFPTPEALFSAAEQLSFPMICKTATAGYDGQGQWRLNTIEDVLSLKTALNPRTSGWVLEKVAPFIKELSILVARNPAGEIITYPVTENVHENRILRLCRIPADISPELAQQISKLAKDILTQLAGVGLFCIELFLLPDETLLINEIAPRPHNSGHYTLDAANISQYEQQVRALCNLPLEQPHLLSSAVMLNLLGDEITALYHPKSIKKILSIPGVSIYDYRKIEIKARRKMGHLTLVGEQIDTLLQYTKEIQDILGDNKNRT